MKTRQIELISRKKYRKRKTARAFDSKRALHVTLKANRSVLRLYSTSIQSILHQAACRYGIQVRALALMSNHLHFLIQAPNRILLGNALRFISSRIAFCVGGGKLWLKRAWSRVVSWGRDYRRARTYIFANPLRADLWEDFDFFDPEVWRIKRRV